MADAYYAVAARAPAPAALLRDDARPGVARALATTAVGIGVAMAGRRLFESVSASSGPAESARYALGTTLLTYAVVAVLLIAVVRTLDWRLTPGSVALGGVMGVGVALLLLRGDVGGTDPRLTLLVSDRSFASIAATVLLGAVAAPLCEEVLFRGVLLESMAHVSTRLAVWTSGFAFAVWHLEPKTLLYYTLFGALFGGVYLHRGLAASVAAHAAFNGTLVVAAMALLFGPGVTVPFGDVVVSAPGGWYSDDDGGRHLHGPDESLLTVSTLALFPATPEQALDLMSRHDTGARGWTLRPGTVRFVRLPVGDAVRVRFTSPYGDGELAAFAAQGQTVVVTVVTNDSGRVRTDFDTMLRDLRVRP